MVSDVGKYLLVVGVVRSRRKKLLPTPTTLKVSVTVMVHYREKRKIKGRRGRKLRRRHTLPPVDGVDRTKQKTDEKE
ncbi:uncharacterized protein HKW66_Vig0107340 [Vigna angularis]|uniref:Uncharacterized protein n=1 Tax=Phaseolus angularis TaxID=3914 RepID=A0A8T0KVQ3_PHAAN|nr:uncharacterized protein HKW66_Vig0107340 [Vigna angularis]